MVEVISVFNAAKNYLRGHASFKIRGDEISLSSSSFVNGYYNLDYTHKTEKQLYNELVDELQPTDVFYDIGANLGFFSALAGVKGAKVFAFEPNPLTFNQLNQNLDANNVEYQLFQIALSDFEGKARLSRGRGPNPMAKLDENGGYRVEVKEGDSLDIPKPDVVKIDVEGHELEVLKGIKGILKNTRPVILYEVHSHQQVKKIDNFLEKMGYNTELLNRRSNNNQHFKAEAKK